MEGTGVQRMKMDFPGLWAAALLIGTVPSLDAIAQVAPPTTGIAQFVQDFQATPPLVREIQFMLLRVGLDPGPIDGIPRQLTNRAVRRFEEMHRLPLIGLEPGGLVPPEFLGRLRIETTRVVLGTDGKTDAGC